jgi:hypothetical protein
LLFTEAEVGELARIAQASKVAFDRAGLKQV